MASFNVQLFLMHILQLHIYMAWFLLCPFPIPLAPLAVLLLLPFVPPFTYLAPSSCDRNRPPSSQVACKLTLFAPPFTQLFHPFQLPRTPIAQRLTTTTLGPLRSHYAEHVLSSKVNCPYNYVHLKLHLQFNRLSYTVITYKFFFFVLRS
jgi:hypothetical protein